MNKQILSIKKAVRYIERKDNNGQPIPFSAKVFKRDGGVALFQDAVCTSSFHRGTMNFRMPNNEVRKIRTIYLIEVDGKEVVL